MDLGELHGAADGVGTPTSAGRALDAFKASLDELIAAIGDGALEGLDDPGLVGFMQGFEQVRNRLPLVDHGIIGDAVRRDLPDALCQGTVRRLLSSVLSVSKGEAGQRVRAFEAVGPRASMLGQPLAPTRPVLAAAQAAGEVSPEKVGIIASAIGQVDGGGFDPDDIAFGEEFLTEKATLMGPEDLRVLAARVVDAINPDGTLPKDELNSDRRHFHLRLTKDGAYAGEFRLTGAAGAKLAAILDPLSGVRPTGPDGQVDERTFGQRRHDALEDVCDRLLRGGDLPDTGGTPATVIITIGIEDLLARKGFGRTADGTLIPTESVLRMTNSADIILTTLASSGAVLDLGRSHRIASRSQTWALIARDGGCSFPGCAHPPQWCERHHIIEWAAGGPTDVDNLTLLCAYHHHNFLARGWTVRMNADRLPEWIPPIWVDRQQKPQLNSRIRAELAARQQKRKEPALF